MSANQANGSGGGYGGGSGKLPNNLRERKTPEQIAELKKKQPCHYRKRNGLLKYGHWSADHNEDGSLKPRAVSSDTPIDDSSNADVGKNSGGAIKNGNVALGVTSAIVSVNNLQ